MDLITERTAIGLALILCSVFTFAVLFWDAGKPYHRPQQPNEPLPPDTRWR